MPEHPPTTLNDLLPLTPGVRAERLAELKRLFPDLFTNEGRLNPDELRQLVEPNEVHETERYEFKWYGKAASKREAFTPTTATLVYDEARSVNPDQADGNMIIEGENLETLKLLLNAYREQVKVIYIDPPYNTGKDFIYRDNYKKDKPKYWEETGAAENGIQLESNPETSGRYHSDWLSMIHSRLLPARSLLRRDGFILVSIDDAEISNLIRIMNEVFGEENHIATLIYDKNRKNDAKFFSVGHEYMVVYAKEKTWLTENQVALRAEKEGIQELTTMFNALRVKHSDNWEAVRTEIQAFYSSLPDEDARKALGRYTKVDEKGPYRDDGNPSWPGGGGPKYDVIHPVTGKPCKTPSRGWVFPKVETMLRKIDEGIIVFGVDENIVPSIRTNLFDKTTQVMRSVNFSYAQTVAQNFAKIFDGKKIFDNPKPTDDLKKLFAYLSNPGDLIVDFFGGSGTSAQAIVELDVNQLPPRKFIVVQIPEAVDEGELAYDAGYRRISDITIERVKRVIEGYGEAPRPIPNTGFKVYRLRKSNFPRCEFKPDPMASDAENVASLRRYIEEKEAAFFLTLDPKGEQAVFDEVLLKNGFQLHYSRSRREDFTHNTVFEIRDPRRSALVCLAWNENLHDATLKRLRELADTGERPFFICLERSLTTTTKWNLKHFLGNHFNAF
jgi:adenine-specific DNA-methyltransferase